MRERVNYPLGRQPPQARPDDRGQRSDHELFTSVTAFLDLGEAAKALNSDDHTDERGRPGDEGEPDPEPFHHAYPHSAP